MLPPKVINIQIKVEFNPGIHIELDSEVGRGDNVLGVITPSQKELFVAALQLQIIANNNFEVANGADANGMKKILKAKADELVKKSGHIMDAFVIDVLEVHNLWGRCNEIDIGVRKGWIIVWTETEEEEVTPYEIGISNN
jgi:hypothetical protein